MEHGLPLTFFRRVPQASAQPDEPSLSTIIRPFLMIAECSNANPWQPIQRPPLNPVDNANAEKSVAPAQGRAFMKFTPGAIEKHIRRKHPGCPDFAIAFFVGEIAKKEWQGASIGMAVGITMQTTLRHLMTDYDQMLLCGWDRDEARRRVRPKVNAMIAKWRKRQT